MDLKNKSNSIKYKHRNNPGFTIVELLVVIVVIGILAAITIVSYTGITAKASESSIKSELANASKKLSMYYAEYESYPTTPGLNLTTGCPTLPNDDTNYCIKFNSGTSITYESDNSNSYDLTFTKNGLSFAVSQNGTIAQTLPESDWITIGTQRWARKNLNVGTRINGVLAQTNNGGTNVVEKYCYGDTDAGCTNTDANGIPYGAFYQWDEAMKYSNTEGAQGICPVGSHIPSDNDLKILEVQLGMTQAVADTSGHRGVEGTKLRFGGSSGLNVPFSGFRNTGGPFVDLSVSALLLSSSAESGSYAWIRTMNSSGAAIRRDAFSKDLGLSVRCLGN